MDGRLKPWITKLLEGRARGGALEALVDLLVAEGVGATAHAWLLRSDGQHVNLASAPGPNGGGRNGEAEPAPALPFERLWVEVEVPEGRVALELRRVGYGVAPIEEELEALLTLALELDAVDSEPRAATTGRPDLAKQLGGGLADLEPDTRARLRDALEAPRGKDA